MKKIREICLPHGEFKFMIYEKIYDGDPIFTVISNNGEDVLCTIPMVQLSLRCGKCAAARHKSVIGNQLLFANNRNRVRWVVFCLSQDGACTDSFENFWENSWKGDQSNDITPNTPLFSLVNTFNAFLLSWLISLFWITIPWLMYFLNCSLILNFYVCTFRMQLHICIGWRFILLHYLIIPFYHVVFLINSMLITS